MSQKEIISLLSREQELKKVFLQLGNQRNIPHDIILLIYNLLRYLFTFRINFFLLIRS